MKRAFSFIDGRAMQQTYQTIASMMDEEVEATDFAKAILPAYKSARIFNTTVASYSVFLDKRDVEVEVGDMVFFDTNTKQRYEMYNGRANMHVKLLKYPDVKIKIAADAASKKITYYPFAGVVISTMYYEHMMRYSATLALTGIHEVKQYMTEKISPLDRLWINGETGDLQKNGSNSLLCLGIALSPCEEYDNDDRPSTFRMLINFKMM